MKQSTIIAVLFWSIAATIICISIMVSPQVTAVDSDTAGTETEIGNATPTVGAITRDSTITLIENGYTAIAWATTTVTDSNGCDEIDEATSVVAVFYDSGAVATSCSSNGRNCYPNASTTCAVTAGSCTGVGDTDAEWSCHAHPWHYSNASSDWKWYIAASDPSSTGSSTSDTITVNALLALDVTEGTINYGTLALNTLSEQSTTTVLNTGNDSALDVGIYENATFTCSVGNITSTYQHYSQSGGFAYGDGTVLWSTSTQTLNSDIVQGSNGSEAPSEAVYWLLTTPAGGVSGTCNGTNYFEAQ